MAEELDFKISTGLKDIIGKELITETHTAIFELVKNAYDANATRVDIVFQNIKADSKTNHGTILIMDDGDGMSYEDIKNKWLFVGYSKKKERDVDKGDFRNTAASMNRVMAGSKGIGRFSSDRLGGKLNLYTKTPAGHLVHVVSMDWGRFEYNQDEEFQNVQIEYRALDQFPDIVDENLRHGTVLEIFPLADKWDRPKLVKLKRYLQRLINPIQISEDDKFEIVIRADEFVDSDRKMLEKNKKQEIINGTINNVVFEKMGINTTQITCSIKKTKITTRITDKGRFVFETEETNSHGERLYDIDITLFYLNKEAKNAFTRIMGMRPLKFGSVFLYKNGFRIHPYGEEKDDWLGLEQRKGQGYARNLSMRELMGRVEINRTQRGFSEVSSRHGGVMETEEYRHLLEFMKARVTRWLERYVVEGLDWDRPKDLAKKSDDDLKKSSIRVLTKFTNMIKDPNKQIKFNPDLMNILEEKMVSDLPEVAKNLQAMVMFAGSGEEQARIKRDLDRLEMIARERARAAAATAKTLEIKEKQLLFWQKSHSPDNDLSADYNHWILISTAKITEYLELLTDAIQKKKDAESLMNIVELMSLENQRIYAVASIITIAGFDLQTETQTSNIVTYIVQYIDNVISKWTNRITFKFYDETTTFEMTFMPLKIAMMIDNFFTNSRKAMANTISILFSTEGRKLRILVSDDGCGVPKEHKEHIFARGFTTTPGSGIGLHHVRSMVQEMGGTVKFLGNNVSGLNRGACFEIVFSADG